MLTQGHPRFFLLRFVHEFSNNCAVHENYIFANYTLQMKPSSSKPLGKTGTHEHAKRSATDPNRQHQVRQQLKSSASTVSIPFASSTAHIASASAAAAAAVSTAAPAAADAAVEVTASTGFEWPPVRDSKTVREHARLEADNLPRTNLHRFLTTVCPQFKVSTGSFGPVYENGDNGGSCSSSASSTGSVTNIVAVKGMCSQCSVPLSSTRKSAFSALSSLPSFASLAPHLSSSPVSTASSPPAPLSESAFHSVASAPSLVSSATVAAPTQSPAEIDACDQLTPHVPLASLWNHFTQPSVHSTVLLDNSTVHYEPFLSALFLYGAWQDPFYFDCDAANSLKSAQSVASKCLTAAAAATDTAAAAAVAATNAVAAESSQIVHTTPGDASAPPVAKRDTTATGVSVPASSSSVLPTKAAGTANAPKLVPFCLEFVEKRPPTERPQFKDSINELLKQKHFYLLDACLHNVDRARSWLAVAWHPTGAGLSQRCSLNHTTFSPCCPQSIAESSTAPRSF
jgi:hypothetical protein